MSKEHPAPYAMELKRSWRVVVPVRGKLTPRICREKFTCRAEALTWMSTTEGHQAIASARGGAPHKHRGEPAATLALARAYTL
jgi:hypothetical protein